MIYRKSYQTVFEKMAGKVQNMPFFALNGRHFVKNAKFKKKKKRPRIMVI